MPDSLTACRALRTLSQLAGMHAKISETYFGPLYTSRAPAWMTRHTALLNDFYSHIPCV